MEVAPSLWNGGASDPVVTWAQNTPMNYQSTIVNNATSPETATATAIGWGYRNTRAIVLQGNSDTATSAAALADSHTVTVEGVVFDDWYLPSSSELDQVNLRRSVIGITANRYWSSTERPGVANNAWSFFITSSGSWGNKNTLNYVRPIRAF